MALLSRGLGLCNTPSDLLSTAHLRATGLGRFGYSTRQIPTSLSSRRRVTVCSSQSEGQPDVAKVTLRVHYRVNYGEQLRVVGTGSTFGNWSPKDGLKLTWSEGDVWTAELPIDAGSYEFKCVVFNTSTDSASRWEDGANRVLDISQEPGAWDVSCTWGVTGDMTPAFTAAQVPLPPAAAPLPAAVQPPAALEDTQAADAEAGTAPEGEPAFAALSGEMPEAQSSGSGSEEEAAATASEAEAEPAAAPALTFAADASGTATLEAAQPVSPGGGLVAFLVATCAAGAVAAAAILAPGGLDGSPLGGRASELLNSTALQSTLAGAQVRAQVQSQLTALTGRVNGAVAAAQEQVAAVADAASAVGAQAAAAPPAVAAQMAAAQERVAAAVAAQVAVAQEGVAEATASVAAVKPVVMARVASVQGDILAGLRSLSATLRP